MFGRLQRIAKVKFSVWPEKIIGRPFWTIFIALLMVTVPSLGLLQLEMTSSPRKAMGADHPNILRLTTLEEKYVKENNFLVVFTTNKESIFHPEFLQVLKEYTDKAWQFPYVTRVDSISNFQYSYGVQDELYVEDLIGDDIVYSAADLARIREVSTTDPRLSGFFVATDGRAAGVNLLASVDLSKTSQIGEIKAEMDTLRLAIEQAHPSIKMHESGYLSLVWAWDRLAKRDIVLIYPLAMVMIFVGLMYFYRNMGAALATFAVAILSSVAGIGSAGLFGGIVSGMTALGALMVMMLALADCVHIVSAVTRLMGDGLTKKQAIAESIRFNFTAIALTSLTTAIGFISFGFADFVAIAHMGRYVAFGVVVAFVLSITLLPALLCFCNLKPKKISAETSRYRNLADLVIRYRWWLLALVLPIGLSSTYLAWFNQLDDSMSNLVHKDDQYRVDSRLIENVLTGTANMIYDLNSGQESGVSNPEFMRKVEQFSDWLKEQPEVRQVTSYTDMMKDINTDLHGGSKDWARLPDSSELAAQYVLLYELSLPYGLDLTTMFDMQKSSTRLSIIINDMSSLKTKELADKFDKKFAEIAPELATVATGDTVASNTVILGAFYAMLYAAITAIFIIGIIVLFTFRAFVPGFLCVVLIVMPLLVTFSIWHLTVNTIGVPALTALCMVIGIVVDNAVHFISKYQKARTLHNKTPADSVRETFVSVGSPLVTNAVVLISGFMLFWLSLFQFNVVLGQITVISLLLSLIGTFTLLPCLLILIEQFKEPKKIIA